MIYVQFSKISSDLTASDIQVSSAILPRTPAINECLKSCSDVQATVQCKFDTYTYNDLKDTIIGIFFAILINSFLITSIIAGFGCCFT